MSYATQTDRHIVGAFFIKYFSAIILGFLLISTVFVLADYHHDRELVAGNERVQVDLSRKTIIRDFETIADDIQHLFGEPPLQAFIRKPDGNTRALLARELGDFAEHKRVYAQVRLINAEGWEQIRINLQGKHAVDVPPDALQYKGDRYYFQAAARLPKGRVYVSPMDLNIEHGVIERPYQPMIRFAAPLFDAKEKFLGIVVLNFRAQIVLDDLVSLVGGSYGHVSLLNREGYWLKARDPEREWGFMLAHDWRFDKVQPDAWSRMQEGDDGQFSTEHGMFTVARIFPLKAMRDGGLEPARQNGGDEEASYVWYIVSDVPLAQLHQELWNEITGPIAAVFFLTLVLGGLASWWLARIKMERARMIQEIRLHADVFRATSDGVMITDPDSIIVGVNEAFTRLTGFPPEEVLGRKPNILRSGRHDKGFYQSLWNTLVKTGHWEGEVWNRRRDGELYLEWLRISSVMDEQDSVVSYVGVVSDITAQKMSEETLRRHAHFDVLTGLPNRLLLEDRMEQAIARADRNQGKVALFFIDLDDFKPINDNYGHQAGDIVLCELGKRMKTVVRESDTVARLGGDEFVIVLADEQSVAYLGEVADRMLRLLNEPIQYETHRFVVGGSIGVAIYPDDAKDIGELISCADTAMYSAKNEARGTYRFYMP